MLKDKNGIAKPAAVKTPDRCFHCDEIIPVGVNIITEVGGERRFVCCHGCKAVVETIRDYGLQKFYEYRTVAPPRPDATNGIAAEFSLYDDVSIQRDFVEFGGGSVRTASLLLENIVCAACCWLIETQLSRLEGIIDVAVNYSNNRARIRWDNDKIRLGAILGEINKLGYKAYPYRPGQQQKLMEKERKNQLRRIALAALLGMQVMMIAIALYVGDWTSENAAYLDFFRWISLGLALPVVVFSAAPFFTRAWRDIRLLKPGMDVPVALGIAVAFGASCWATVTGKGEVYFDSVVMFVFLLSLGRYLEFMARKKAVEHTESLGQLLPVSATRLAPVEGGGPEIVPVSRLTPGDVILIRPGEIIPIDGLITDGVTTVDESILTGESFPVKKERGAAVFGGSTNVDSPVEIRVGNTGKETLIARIQALVEQGRDIKPAFIELTDRIAGWFVLFVLLSAGLTAVYWYHAGATRWLPVTIAVLIITCPCALSLAMPAALASSVSALMKRGIAVVRYDALETLAKSTWFIFDKTGTLTEGKLKLTGIELLAPGIDEATCLDIARALEQSSEHPIARALARATTKDVQEANTVRNYPGEGIMGTVGHTEYYLGTENFIRKNPATAVCDEAYNGDDSVIYLADNRKRLAALFLSDELRTDAAGCIAAIHAQKKHTALLSGDKESAVTAVARRLNIGKSWSRQTPKDKIEKITALQRSGEVVAMAGDGVNDAPVLAAADVSFAMGGGTDLTRANADIILLNDHLLSLSGTLDQAMRTMKIIKQNLFWAFTYNLIALPAAASGYAVPWMAALGMSLSSLLVVLNSLRLARIPDHR